MSEELGRIEKPSVEAYRTGKKLFFVPLIFAPLEPQADLLEKVNRYWDQVEAHVANLETKLGSVSRVYHELVPIGGEDGAKAVELLSKLSHKTDNPRLEKEAE